MPQVGQVARRQDIPAQAEPSAAELLDPVALEARLVEARARRAEVMARRAAGGTPAAPARERRVIEVPAPRIAARGGSGARVASVVPSPRAALPEVAPAAEPPRRPRSAMLLALVVGVAAGAVGTAAGLSFLKPMVWDPLVSARATVQPTVDTEPLVAMEAPAATVLPDEVTFVAARPARVPEQGLTAAPAVEALPAAVPIEPEVAAAVTAFATAPAVAGPVAALRSPGTVSPAPVVAPLGAASIEAPAGLAASPDVGGVELASDPGALAEVAALMSAVPSVEAQAPGRPLAVAGGGSLQLSVGGEVWDVAEARRLAEAPVAEVAPTVAPEPERRWAMVRFAAGMPQVPVSAANRVSWASAADATVGYDLARPPAATRAAAGPPQAAPARTRVTRSPTVSQQRAAPDASARARLVERAVLENAVENMLRDHLRGN
jgi:hypothetical protein